MEEWVEPPEKNIPWLVLASEGDPVITKEGTLFQCSWLISGVTLVIYENAHGAQFQLMHDAEGIWMINPEDMGRLVMTYASDYFSLLHLPEERDN